MRWQRWGAHLGAPYREASMKNWRVVLSLCVALAVIAGAGSLSIAKERAAEPGKAASPQGAPTKSAKATKAPATPQIDEEYTAKIREYTTEKHFMTELVD